MQKNDFRFMNKQIKCYNCHRVILVQKWEAIFQMIYFVTYSEKYLLIKILANYIVNSLKTNLSAMTLRHEIEIQTLNNES